MGTSRIAAVLSRECDREIVLVLRPSAILLAAQRDYFLTREVLATIGEYVAIAMAYRDQSPLISRTTQIRAEIGDVEKWDMAWTWLGNCPCS